MKNYQIYIKSHTNYPDYEDECEAESLEEAAEIFEMRIAKGDGDFRAKELESYIAETED